MLALQLGGSTAELRGVFGYCGALAAERPFPTAAANLQLLFQRARRWEPSGKEHIERQWALQVVRVLQGVPETEPMVQSLQLLLRSQVWTQSLDSAPQPDGFCIEDVCQVAILAILSISRQGQVLHSAGSTLCLPGDPRKDESERAEVFAGHFFRTLFQEISKTSETDTSKRRALFGPLVLFCNFLRTNVSCLKGSWWAIFSKEFVTVLNSPFVRSQMDISMENFILPEERETLGLLPFKEFNEMMKQRGKQELTVPNEAVLLQIQAKRVGELGLFLSKVLLIHFPSVTFKGSNGYCSAVLQRKDRSLL